MVVILALLALGAPLARCAAPQVPGSNSRPTHHAPPASHARGTFALGCFLTALLIPSLSVAAGTRWAAWHRCVLQLRCAGATPQAAMPAAAGTRRSTQSFSTLCSPSGSPLRFVDRVEQALVFPAVLAAAGAWVGALPLVLDWDSPWQQYPVPVAVGAVAGRALGGLALPWLPPPQRKQ